ncbi:hypothetical protein DFH11DRAFT_281162 [Phellopilus nigrolimitatus]|nr:hypothetical protein DFH11DRAFT_281162 [Phellopilus nigrolimitatus]
MYAQRRVRRLRISGSMPRICDMATRPQLLGAAEWGTRSPVWPRTIPFVPNGSQMAQQMPVTSFRASTVQCGETSDNQAQRRPDSASTRRHSRSRSLLKFVSRRPFSSSGAGFVPPRAPQTPTTAALDPESGLEFGAGAAARFSAACSSKDGGRISATMSDGRGEKAPAAGSTAQPSRPRSSSYSPPGDQAKNQRIESPLSPAPMTKNNSRKLSASASKARSWSFTRSRSQSHRRSRSLSPAPTKGSPRDVLFRLRSARNWFWYALSSMTSRSSSGSGSRSKKGVDTKWATPQGQFVAAAA